MIIKIFKSNYLIGLFIIPIVSLILSLSVFFVESSQIMTTQSWQIDFFKFIYDNTWLNYLLTLIITTANALLLNRLFNKSHFYSKTSYIPAIVYLILLSYSHYISFNPYLISHFFLILLIDILFKANQNMSAIDIMFKAGLIQGLLFTIESHYIFLLPFSLIAILIVKSFNLREVLVFLIGFSVPLIWLVSLLFLFDKPISLFNFKGTYQLQSQLQLIDYFQIGSLILIALISLLPLLSYYNRNKVIVKKHLSLVLLLQIFTAVLLIIAFQLFGALDYGLLVPLTIIISIYIHNSKSDSLISLILTFALIINIFALYWY